MIGIYIAAVVLCVIGSAFFSASEMSYSALNRVRMEHAAENGSRAAKTVLRILDRFDNALSAILVGNNLVNIAASSLGSVAVLLTLGSEYAWVATAAVTAAVIIFGETIPKITAKKNANRYALAFAPVIRFLMILLRPVTFAVVGLVDLLTKGMKGETIDEEEAEEAAVEELHSIIEAAENENVLDEDASELVSAAIDFSDTSASEIMTARVDILAIDIDDNWDEIMETVTESPYSRLPVYKDSIDNVIGMLPLNHVLRALISEETVDLGKLLLPACYVYKTMKLPAVFETLQKAQQHLAVVTDEYGGTLGVVSMEDVLEELVGEIWDETDTAREEYRRRESGGIEIDGDLPISDFTELMKWDEDAFDFDSETVGGWCIEMLEGFPEEGDAFSYDGISVTVLEMDERRVRRVVVKKNQTEENSGGD
ncbi:MAG: HlyC/CorC family transporter [Lachnospiraceae bacterium]|nr:HlyC/CorC family transporter [Lachnospiraceae bacterium]